jgi:hypothetical protein
MKDFRRGQSERLDKLECLVNRKTGNEPRIIRDLFAGEWSATMPIERVRLDQMIEKMDTWLKQNKKFREH